MEHGTLVAGRYELVGRLGRGGMGEVWAGYDRTLGRAVAVKLLALDDADADADLPLRFRREAVAAAQINHPNVVTLHDSGAHEDLLYLVMERVEGRTLAEYVRDEAPLSLDRSLEIAEQVCAALAAAHRAGIVHYDIKPQNIMLTGDGQHLKVVDFGVAGFLRTVVTDLARSSRLAPAGTPEYGAPEQFLDERGDESSDLYALGSVLFALLTGEPPFLGRSALALVRRKLDEPAPPLAERRPDLPADLTALVDALLDRDPARRPGPADQVLERLRRLRTSTGTPAARTPAAGTPGAGASAPGAPGAAIPPHPPTVLDHPVRRPGRGRLLAITAALVGLAGAGALTFEQFHGEPPTDTTRTPVAGPAGTPTAGASSSACPQSSDGTGPIPQAADVTVNVYNTTSHAGIAGPAADALRQRGFKIGVIGNAPLALEGKVTGTAQVIGGPAATRAIALVSSEVSGATTAVDGRTDGTVDLALGDAFTALLSPAEAATTGVCSATAHPPATIAAAAPGSTAHSVVVEVTASASTVYLMVKDGTGKYLFQGNLDSGGTQSFTDPNKLVLVIGNAGGVRIRENGTDLGPPGADGQVVHLTYTADDRPAN